MPRRCSRRMPPTTPGVVWLIGAGPGAEDLLTLRAQRLLQEADVIVHDQLVPDAVVEMGRRDAERISVGKRAGPSLLHPGADQRAAGPARAGRASAWRGSRAATRWCSAAPARKSRRCARPASPTTSCRASRAALAAAAETATPVTLRKVSPGFVFATAHGASDEELKHWASLAASGLTLALYMGKSIAASTAIRFIARRRARHRRRSASSSTPGARDREFHRGTLGELADGGGEPRAMGRRSFFVGEAVAEGDWTDAASLADSQTSRSPDGNPHRQRARFRARRSISSRDGDWVEELQQVRALRARKRPRPATPRSPRPRRRGGSTASRSKPRR